MARKSLLRFVAPDGSVDFEMLGHSGEFAELVDPDDGSVLHTGPFTMHGREWTIASVTLGDRCTFIECVSRVANAHSSSKINASNDSSTS